MPRPVRKWIVKVRMWYADIRGHHGKRWNYESSDRLSWEKKKMKLGPEQNVQMPMKTVISLIIMVSLGTMGYFQIQEKLNQHDTLLQMHTKDLDQNSEFRIKYPRGELGQSSGESELFMLVEHMAGQITKMEERMEDMMSNSVNIERLQKDVEKVLSDIEKLKDKQRTFANGNNTP